jgi:putative cardiolipin synthase
MKHSSQSVLKVVLATAVALASFQSTWAQTHGDLLPMDATDAQIAQARSSSLHALKERLFGKAADENKDPESIRKLKILMAKREFATWFRFSDEVSRNLNASAGDLNALVKPVILPQEGYLAKLMMIRQAKYTVDLTYYIFSIDESGQALVNELMAAVRRGVSVRVMVDSLGSLEASMKGNPHFRTMLEDARLNAGYMTDPATGLKTSIRAKVEVLTFNPVSNLPAAVRSGFDTIINTVDKSANIDTTHWNPNRRSHDKIIITDAQFPELSIAMIGGRNISNHYYELDPSDHENFRDAEVIIRNDPAIARTMNRNKSVGEVLNQQYDRLYFHRANRRLTEGLLRYVFNHKKQMAKLDKATLRVEEVTQATLKSLDEDFNSPDFGKKYLATGFSDDSVNFVNSTHNLLRDTTMLPKVTSESVTSESYEKIGRDAASEVNQQSLLSKMAVLASRETKSITVISPYLWLSARDIKFVQDWLSQDARRTFTVFTNSIVTSDNMPAQTIVDVQTAPGLLANRKFASQIKVYEYGRADDVNLGGKKYYGKLHFKGAYFSSLKTSLITTYNKDPRSQMLNSEIGVIVSGDYAKNMEREIADLYANSHEFGSDEYREIRANPRLSKMKQEIIKHEAKIYELMINLHLWWLI